MSLPFIISFLQIFNNNDITRETWIALSHRIGQQIAQKEESIKKHYNSRYSSNCNNSHSGIPILYEEKGEFKGIINYLKKNSKGDIENEISVTSSSTFSTSYDPRNILIYYDKAKRFLSEDNENFWICIDFKEHRVIPTNYTIKTFELSQNSAHPKSWIIEASNDNDNWDVIDERNNCPFLNGRNFIHTFIINNQNLKSYRYIRMRQTKPNWTESIYLMISCIEFFGTLF